MRGQKRGEPFIEEPDDIETKHGEACWLNSSRVCAPDCIAYNVEETDEHGSPVQGPAKCMIIVLGGQIASAATALVQLKQRDQKAKQPLPAEPPIPKVGT